MLSPVPVLTVLLSGLVAYLGLPLGALFIRMAEEERAPGRPYFRLAVLLTALGFAVHALAGQFSLLLLAATLLFLVAFFAKRDGRLCYLFFALVFPLLGTLVSGLLIFGHGLAAGALLPKKEGLKEALRLSWFIPVSGLIALGLALAS